MVRLQRIKYKTRSPFGLSKMEPISLFKLNFEQIAQQLVFCITVRKLESGSLRHQARAALWHTCIMIQGTFQGRSLEICFGVTLRCHGGLPLEKCAQIADYGVPAYHTDTAGDSKHISKVRPWMWRLTRDFRYIGSWCDYPPLHEYNLCAIIHRLRYITHSAFALANISTRGAPEGCSEIFVTDPCGVE